MIGSSPIASRPIAANVAVTGAYILDASSDSFVLNGADASLLVNRNLNLESNSYTLLGSTVSFIRDLVLPAYDNSYALVGDDCSLIADRNLSLQSNSYVLSGSSANLARQLNLIANAGIYNITFPVPYVLKWYTGTAWQILYKDPIVYP